MVRVGTSHLDAGKMCLFFSYQCLSTTFPACDCKEIVQNEKILSKLIHSTLHSDIEPNPIDILKQKYRSENKHRPVDCT